MTTRPARNQADVDLLPPWGKPEVHVEGAIGTLIIAGAAGAALLGSTGS